MTGPSRPDERGALRTRRGGADDALVAADLYVRARAAATRAGTIPAGVHPEEDVRRWFAEHVAAARELWLAETPEGTLAAILVLDDGWVDQLYVDPALTGRGIGARLLALAKRRRPSGLQLWAFESNAGARRFYERHGFMAVERTDGSANEERAPDVRYRWPGSSSQISRGE